MSNPPDTNPYAPSALAASLPPETKLDVRRSATLGVMFSTFGGVVLSGGLFGMLLGCAAAIFNPTGAVESLFLLPVGLFTGGVLAALSGFPSVILLVCLSAPLVPLSKGWLPRQRQRLAAGCGFLSGLSPVVLTGLSDPYTWAISIVPAIFGALGTLLFVQCIYRRSATPAP